MSTGLLLILHYLSLTHGAGTAIGNGLLLCPEGRGGLEGLKHAGALVDDISPSSKEGAG